MAIILIQSCQSNTCHLKQKYSVEVINYFYETAFFSDLRGKQNIVYKWKNDVYIYITTKDLNDVDLVKNAIIKIDSLQLSIDMHITSDSSKANMFIYFGDYSYLRTVGIKDISDIDSLNYVGKAEIFTYPDMKPVAIRLATIGIANDNKYYKKNDEKNRIKIRQSAVLEEMAQCLGIVGDSWHYTNSMFFERNTATSNFSAIDKGILQFLYEPSIPTQYSQQQFEKDFGEVLHHINAPQKIVDYVLANDIPLHHLEYIREKSFRDSILIKWPSEICVSLKGGFSLEGSIFCENVVGLFNSVSDQFQLSLTHENDAYIFPKINISYTLNDTISDYVTEQRRIHIEEMMFPRRCIYDIKINAGEESKQETIYRTIFSALYESLGFNNQNANYEVMKIDSLDNISFKPDYKEILALIYEPVFYSGLTIGELEEAIEKIEGYYNE